MNLLRELRGIVRQPNETTETATVIQADGPRLIVRTRYGLRNVTSAGISTYSSGDEVRVQGGVVLGKATPSSSVPVFRV